jgi:hypothetical protein
MELTLMRQDEVIETTILSNENDIQTILYRFFFDQNSINKKLLAQKEVSFHKNMKIASRCQLDGRQVIATHPTGGKKFFFGTTSYVEDPL